MLMIRKIFKFIILNIKDRDIISRYHELEISQYNEDKGILGDQLDRLNSLLNHAYNYVPYYKKILKETGLVSDGVIKIECLDQIRGMPFLTKDILRKEKVNLCSLDMEQRKPFYNSSGGSTGEPVVLLQDFNYAVNNMANTYLAYSWRGASPYDNTVVLWGAERDTFEGKKPFKEIAKDFLLNTLRLNTFSLSDECMKKYLMILNKREPKLVIGYVQSMYELAKYAKKNNIVIKQQAAIHAAAGTVYDFMRDEIEEVFQCKVFNYYGSREVGAIASECKAHDGLHIIMEHSLVEIVDKNGKPCKPGEEGDIVVTTLNNYSMPLIRYKIGDIGIMQSYTKCECGCSYPKLEKVVGRTADVFKTASGSVVMPEYFIHLIGVVYNRGNIKTFQVIQESYEEIIIKIISIAAIEDNDLQGIVAKIKIVMGDSCKVRFDFVDNIPKTSTGKYLYTISKL